MQRSIIFLLGFGLCLLGHANNIDLSNITLTGQNTTDQTVLVQFDVSWENSWRLNVGPSNWDAIRTAIDRTAVWLSMAICTRITIDIIE
ncbi:MAG: hypothetical protein AAFQ87_15835, partial [Bacteroidota bacterium]